MGVLTDLDIPVENDSIFEQLQPEQKKGMLKGVLLIDPNYVHLFKTDTKILLREPKFSLNKEQISKIGELFRGDYFDVLSGSGEAKNAICG